MRDSARTRAPSRGALTLLTPLLHVEPSLAWWEPTPLGLLIYVGAVGLAIAMFRRAAALRRRARGRRTRAVARR